MSHKNHEQHEPLQLWLQILKNRF